MFVAMLSCENHVQVNGQLFKKISSVFSVKANPGTVLGVH